jgi:hypothetical protein
MLTFNSNSQTFISVGRGANGYPDGSPYPPNDNFGMTNDNQLTILNSANGVNWGLTYTGGYYGENKKGIYNSNSPILIPPIQAYGNDYGALTRAGLIYSQATGYANYNALANASFTNTVRDWADRLRTAANRPNPLLTRSYEYGINL